MGLVLACSKQEKIRKRPGRARSVQTTNLEVVAKRVLEPKVIFSRAQGDALHWWLVKEKWGHAVPSSAALTTIQCV